MLISQDQKIANKLYYSIGEVAEMFDVNTSLIRFWEKEFSIIKPSKNKKGNRLFTQKDIENFKKIFQLVKVEGYTLDGAKLKLKKNDEPSKMQELPPVVLILEDLKRRLIRLQAEI